ncbi:MAG: hypothetical protein AseanaTS_30510 [Candidatus Pelagadaptatus aseana]|uniref:hypothetical protein n=1 Tax=Candidatus Pelagadaptatus aseana TaxID=3120508 RepID=UPI0039B28DDF
MDRLKVLKLSVLGLFAIGGLSIASVFLSSMNPSAKAELNLVKLKVSDLTPGDFSTGESNYYMFFAYITKNDHLKVVEIPYFDSKVLLPDYNWDRPIVECTEFVFPILPNGKWNLDGEFRCIDAGLPKHWLEMSAWDINGKNISGDLPDLRAPDFSIENGYVVIGRS